MPNPAFDKSPDITAPKLIEPLISSIVSAIDTAQLGISPINAVITGSRSLIFPSNVCSIAYLPYTKIKKLRSIVIIRIKANIFNVCLSG